MILDYIDKAYYINLDYRTDRKEIFENQIKNLGFDAERYDAVQLKLEDIDNPFRDTSWHKKMGCCQSHINLIKLAKEQNLKNIWILEDDCTFVDGFMEKAKKCIDELKNLEWDVFYFGGEPNREAEPHSDLLVKTNGVYGAHSYIVNHTFYDKVITHIPNNTLLDVYYLSFNEADKNFYLSKELLCLQDGNSESDLWGGKVDRTDNYNLAYKQFIK
jgi:GR25 family glycosyltransferase involved in LPS biosynthesis